MKKNNLKRNNSNRRAMKSLPQEVREFGIVINQDGNDEIAITTDSVKVRKERLEQAFFNLLEQPEVNSRQLVEYLITLNGYINFYERYGLNQILSDKLDEDFFPSNPFYFPLLNITVVLFSSNVYQYLKDVVNNNINP